MHQHHHYRHYYCHWYLLLLTAVFFSDHCMVSFVKPNLLGTRKEFTNTFVNPIQNGQCADSTSLDVQIMKQRCHVLHKMLEGCVQVGMSELC